MIYISSNHFSFDDQVKDAVTYIRNNGMLGYDYSAFLERFPEWENLVWSDSWVDTDLSNVDVEYTSWVCDWIENKTDIIWNDGEPVILQSPSDYESLD